MVLRLTVLLLLEAMLQVIFCAALLLFGKDQGTLDKLLRYCKDTILIEIKCSYYDKSAYFASAGALMLRKHVFIHLICLGKVLVASK